MLHSDWTDKGSKELHATYPGNILIWYRLNLDVGIMA
jgi:hypothetical protein